MRTVPLFIIAALFLGCKNQYQLLRSGNPVTGKWEVHVIEERMPKGIEWAWFEESIQKPLAEEKARQPPRAREMSWAEYWISRWEGSITTGHRNTLSILSNSAV